MGTSHQKDQAMIRSLEFSVLPQRLGRRARNGVNDGSSLCDEASIKISKVGGSENFQVGEHMEVAGDWHTGRQHGTSYLFPQTLLYASLPSGC